MARISVIDDSKASIDMMAAILRESGHNITSYQNPTGVEERIAQDKPDLVLLDIVMPERNGYEVLRAIKRNPTTKDIPIILVSSKGEETDIRWGLRQGAVEYITKPFTAESVKNALGKHVK
jgi:twitching motility two-component system response regulator PilH